jgi:putative peptide zinc metalloprotease protein
LGAIVEIARKEIDHASAQISAKGGGDLATATDALGGERPTSVSYQALVPLDDAEGVLRPGLRGRAKVHTPPRTIASRLWRAACETFNFRL